MKRRILPIVLLLSALAFSQAVTKPNWELEVISWDFNMAYPGTQYDFRLAVIGGTYPYKFTLQTGPAGMVLDTNTGAMLWDAPNTESSKQCLRDSSRPSLICFSVLCPRISTKK